MTTRFGRQASQIVAVNFVLKFVIAGIGGSLSNDPVLSRLAVKKLLVGASKVGHEQLRIGAALGGVDLKCSDHLNLHHQR